MDGATSVVVVVMVVCPSTKYSDVIKYQLNYVRVEKTIFSNFFFLLRSSAFSMGVCWLVVGLEYRYSLVSS